MALSLKRYKNNFLFRMHKVEKRQKDFKK